MENVMSFVNRPFGAVEMTAVDWFLFIGFFLVCMIAWRLILSHIVAEI